MMTGWSLPRKDVSLGREAQRGFRLRVRRAQGLVGERWPEPGLGLRGVSGQGAGPDLAVLSGNGPVTPDCLHTPQGNGCTAGIWSRAVFGPWGSCPNDNREAQRTRIDSRTVLAVRSLNPSQ